MFVTEMARGVDRHAILWLEGSKPNTPCASKADCKCGILFSFFTELYMIVMAAQVW